MNNGLLIDAIQKAAAAGACSSLLTAARLSDRPQRSTAGARGTEGCVRRNGPSVPAHAARSCLWQRAAAPSPEQRGAYTRRVVIDAAPPH